MERIKNERKNKRMEKERERTKDRRNERRARERKLEKEKQSIPTHYMVISNTPQKPFLLEEQCKVHMLCMSLPNNDSMGVGGNGADQEVE